MAFDVVSFDERILFGDPDEVEKILRIMKECNVLNTVICTDTGTTPDHIRKLCAHGHILEIWPCADNEENVIGSMLAHHKIPARDALYVGCAASNIRRAKKAGVTTVCLASEYHSPPYMEETKPHYLIKTLQDAVSIVRAQL